MISGSCDYGLVLLLTICLPRPYFWCTYLASEYMNSDAQELVVNLIPFSQARFIGAKWRAMVVD